MLFVSCVARQTYDKAAGMIENQDAVIRSLQEENLVLSSENQNLARNMALSSADADKARKDRDLHKGAVSRLENQLNALESIPAPIEDTSIPGVSITRTSEGTKYSVASTVLFDTGKSTIKKNGQDTLKQLISRFGGRQNSIRVEGHSDNVPVVQEATLKKYPRGNLELSGNRALVVADFMIKNGLDSSRISYAGYGEYRPVADNDSPGGRKKNRRVDILVIDQP